MTLDDEYRRALNGLLGSTNVVTVQKCDLFLAELPDDYRVARSAERHIP